MRAFPSSLFTLARSRPAYYSINDVTVPYMTAYVDLEDPFINHTTDDLAVYANNFFYMPISDFLTISVENTKINTIRSLNLSPYGIHHCQNPVAPARLLWTGSGLTSRRSLLVYRFRFRSTSYVFTVTRKNRSLIP